MILFVLACQKIKEINEKLDDFQEEIDALKETKPGELLCPQ